MGPIIRIDAWAVVFVSSCVDAFLDMFVLIAIVIFGAVAVAG